MTWWQKLKRKIAPWLIATTLVAGSAAPIIPDASTHWQYSYSGPAFDTNDGLLKRG